jgi:hypothetical protein
MVHPGGHDLVAKITSSQQQLQGHHHSPLESAQ